MNDRQRVVVIGASAGGVRALLQIAPKLVPDFAAPILVVLHIGAHRSNLPELLNRRGPVRAAFAEDGETPRPATIHVAPPDHHLLLEDGVLRLFRGPKEHHARPAINPLFRSAALARGAEAIGVVLTGMLDDGAAGLRAIGTCGGTTVVQDPNDAAEPSMPRSAMAAVAVDHVVTLEKVAPLLNSLVKQTNEVKVMTPPEWLRIEHAISVGKAGMDDLARIAHPSSFTCPDCGGALFELEDGGNLRFLCHTGHAFSLRTLAWTHEQVADEALWSGLRALQEKEGILRRLAGTQQGEPAELKNNYLAEADKLAQFIAEMRKMVMTAPPTPSPVGELEDVEAEGI